MIKYLLLLLFSVNAFALSVPRLTQPVMDVADILRPEEENRLNDLMRSLHNEGLIQISVLVIPSLQGEVLEEYSMKVAQKWALGSAIKDNGLLILMAMEERKIRIEVGQGIEGDVTDYLSSRVISKMGPYMRTAEYEEALTNAIRIIESAMRENTPEYKEQIRQQQLQAEILRLEQEKRYAEERAIREEREAAQRAIDEKEYAEKMEKFKKVGIPAGSIALILLASFFIYASFQNDKKIEVVNSTIKSEKKKTKDLQSELEDIKKSHSELKVDSVKYNFVVLQNEVKSLKNKKHQLINSISSMKSYLGVP